MRLLRREGEADRRLAHVKRKLLACPHEVVTTQHATQCILLLLRCEAPLARGSGPCTALQCVVPALDCACCSCWAPELTTSAGTANALSCGPAPRLGCPLKMLHL